MSRIVPERKSDGTARRRARAVALRPRVAVVGSINLDLSCRCARLPGPGETVTGATLVRGPGGKGANQAVAAARLGATVRMIGAVGDDAFSAEMLENLRRQGVDTGDVRVVHGETGLALVVVGVDGENQIVVAPGANASLDLTGVDLSAEDAVLCQLEVPMSAVAAAAQQARGLFCVNAAPAAPLPSDVVERADLIIVNEVEYAALDGLGATRLVALTLGARGAVLFERGAEVCRAVPPTVKVVDTVGAGDAFCAALVVSLLEGRDRETALARACTAGAIAVSRPGAQSSLPTAEELDRWLQ